MGLAGTKCSGTIIVSKYMVGFGREREAESFMSYRERRVKSCEEQADVGDLLVTQ